jgi:hypothetical protein
MFSAASAIAGLIDAFDAWRRAAFDLVEQARPRAIGEEAIGAAAQKEQLLERGERGPDRAGAGERPVILPIGPPRAAMQLRARERMIFPKQDEGEAFVVAEQDIVGRPVALDQLRLEQQRLRLGVGGDDQHVAGLRDHALQPLREPRDLSVVGDPVLQRPRLANVEHVALRIEHAVYAGAYRKGPQHVTDRSHARFKVRLVGATDGVGGLFFVETVGWHCPAHESRRCSTVKPELV